MPSFSPSDLPVAKVHGLLLGAVGPRPIAFASTLSASGQPNLAPFSFFNVFSANPPILIFSPARRGKDATTKHTYENALKVKEIVINVVTYGMVQQMSLASCEFPEGVNEFEKAGFTMLPSEVVQPFRVKESPAQFECVVNDVVSLGTGGGAGNLVICEVVRMHFDDGLVNADLHIDQTRIDTVARMGGNWYARAHGKALFEVPKPGAVPGVGVDRIPADIRNSHFLTGNDLGLLGSATEIPNETDVNEWRLTALSELFITNEANPQALEKALHQEAATLLTANKVREAWLTLLSFNN